jgi:hypothetical protein
VAIAPRDGQAGAASAGTISVFAKSPPFNSSGIFRFFASAYEAQSPQFQSSRMTPFAEQEKCQATDFGEFVVVRDDLQRRLTYEFVEPPPCRLIAAPSGHDH